MAKKSNTLGTDLTNLGSSIYGYTQGKKGYNDLMERYRDAILGNTNATNTATGLLNDAYDASSGYSADKYKALNDLVNQSYGSLKSISANQYKVSNAINKNNLKTQNSRIVNNLKTQNKISNNKYRKSENILKSNLKSLQKNASGEFGKEDALYRNELANQKKIAQQGYEASRSDLSGQMNPAINAYNPYTQGGANAQGLLNRFLTGNPSTRTADYIKTPGYDFRYNEGMNALDRSASARGNLLSGAAAKEAMRYGQGMAQQGYDSYLDRLSQSSNQGLNAVNAQGNLRQNYGNALANTSTNRANAFSGANQNYTNSQSGNINDLYRQSSNNLNDYNQGRIGNVQDLHNKTGQNYDTYVNSRNQNTGAYNQQALNNLSNNTSMNTDATRFNYEQRTGNVDNRYNDLANIVMGKNQNQANLGLQNQGVINDILAKMAQEQYKNTTNTQPLSNVIGTGGQLLNSVFGNGSGSASSGSNWLSGIGKSIGSWF